MKIRLTGHVEVPPARWDAVLAALPEHIRLSQAEPGCLQFLVVPLVAAGRLEVDETFRDRAAFDAHQARLAGTGWARATTGLVRHYQVAELPA